MTEPSPPIERILIARDEEDLRNQASLDVLQQALGRYSIEEVDDIAQADAMVALGGDGAFLHAARRYDYAPVPMTGINAGTLGYYMSTPPDPASIDYMVRNLATGDYHIHNLPLLELKRLGGELVRLAANDIVIRADGFQAFKAGLVISGTQFEHFTGSELVFSTPQGSSGESLAYGGPFLREGLPIWSVVPGAGHHSKDFYSLISSMVLGAEDDVVVEVKEANRRPFAIGTDGAKVTDWSQQEAAFRVAMSQEKSIQRIRLNNNSYLQDVSRIFRGRR
ncbi:MAG: inorganic polyphosphate/ATP-NAD kinase [Candidatus Saccharibacteria bacterium]|nr:inorganic polyphosphate/ATP-NAD kinase [Candidatus Saccharibacteria bacterium]